MKPFPIYPKHVPSLVRSTPTYMPMKMEQSVPKRQHIKFRRRGIIQKKAYNNHQSFYDPNPAPSHPPICHKIYTKISLGRFQPFTGHEGPQGEQRYSSTLIQTSALEGGERSASRPGSTLPPGKTRYPLYRRLGGPQGLSGLVRKILPHRDSIPGPSSPQAVAIPTTLPGPHTYQERIIM